MIRDRAIILCNSTVRESDLLLHALTEQHGKMQFLARGARKSRKRFMGGLDVFDCGQIEFSRPRNANHTPTLEQFQAAAPWLGITRSLDALLCAALCVEVADHFCPLEDASSGSLFRALYSTLKAINSNPKADCAVAAASYYSLLVLEHAGLDAITAIPTVDTTWFASMLYTRAPIIPTDTKHYRSMGALLTYLEQEAGRTLRSKSQMQGMVQRLHHTR